MANYQGQIDDLLNMIWDKSVFNYNNINDVYQNFTSNVLHTAKKTNINKTNYNTCY